MFNIHINFCDAMTADFSGVPSEENDCRLQHPCAVGVLDTHSFFPPTPHFCAPAPSPDVDILFVLFFFFAPMLFFSPSEPFGPETVKNMFFLACFTNSELPDRQRLKPIKSLKTLNPNHSKPHKSTQTSRTSPPRTSLLEPLLETSPGTSQNSSNAAEC